MSESDGWGRQTIIAKGREVLEGYGSGITVRQLYYRLVAIGMPNDINHYKRVVKAMTVARWDNIIDMTAFIDREREMYGETEDDEVDVETEIEHGKQQVKAWLRAYHLKRWSNQPTYVEVGIEKKALQGVFEEPCLMANVGLAPFKGYPSITFLNDMAERYQEADDEGKELVLIYFGDYDPSGSDIPRSIQENLERMGVSIEVDRIALNPDLIRELGLPGAPPKVTDSRTANWDGAGAVELDAVEPKMLSEMCTQAIIKYFDDDLHDELLELEKTEREQYQEALQEFVNDLVTKDDEGTGE